jgi:hypothetical protein
MPDPTLRFAAGSPERPNSGVWRLWTHGSDTYLAARIAAHLFKLSMHQSGQWISAFTSQSGVVVDKETGSRRHRTWTRPPEFTTGWVQGPAVAIPWVKWRGQFHPIGKPPPPNTVWVPGPARKRKLVFNVLFALPPFRPMPSTRCRSPAIGSSAAFRSPTVRRYGSRLGRQASRQMSARASPR